MNILLTSIQASIFILVVILIRIFAIHKLPKKTFLVLWGIAIACLLIPVSIPSKYSIYTLLDFGYLKENKPLVFDINNDIVLTPVTPPVSISDHVMETDTKTASITDLITDADEIHTPVGSFGISISSWALIWVIGMMVCACYVIVTYMRCHKEFKKSLPIQDEYIAEWLQEHRLKKHSFFRPNSMISPLQASEIIRVKIKRKIQIRSHDQINSPLTYGVWRPMILLPKNINWSDLEQMQFILTHEYIHIKRFDALTKMILTFVLCMYWFHPLVWVMYILANRDMELACDETVIRELGEGVKAKYAMMLIRMEDKKRNVTLLYNHFSKYLIKERINGIMKIKKHTYIGILISLILITGTTIAFATSAVKDETDILEAEEATQAEDEADVLETTEAEEKEDISAPVSDKDGVTAYKYEDSVTPYKYEYSEDSTKNPDAIPFEEAIEIAKKYIKDFTQADINGATFVMNYYPNKTRYYWMCEVKELNMQIIFDALSGELNFLSADMTKVYAFQEDETDHYITSHSEEEINEIAKQFTQKLFKDDIEDLIRGRQYYSPGNNLLTFTGKDEHGNIMYMVIDVINQELILINNTLVSPAAG